MKWVGVNILSPLRSVEYKGGGIHQLGSSCGGDDETDEKIINTVIS